MTAVTRRLVLLAGAALLLLGILSTSLIAVREPLGVGDYVGIWGLKARALYRSGSLESLFRVDPAGDFSHPEYPPLWPILLAGFSSLSGRYDDLVVTLLWPLLCVAASLLAVRAARASLPFAALAGAAVALLPYWRKYPGYAEALLVVFVLAAVGEADRLERDRWAPLRLALFLFLAAWTKTEGAVAALVAAGLLFAAGRRRVALLTALSIVLFAVLPWSLLLAAHGGAPGAFALSAFSFGKLGTAAGALARDAAPHAAWLLGAAALLALAPRTWRRRRAVVAGTATYLTLLFGSFAFSRFDPAWHVAWSWDRLIFVPAAVLIPFLCEAVGEAVTDG